jgi:hypothetical protein
MTNTSAAHASTQMLAEPRSRRPVRVITGIRLGARVPQQRAR